MEGHTLLPDTQFKARGPVTEKSQLFIMPFRGGCSLVRYQPWAIYNTAGFESRRARGF